MSVDRGSRWPRPGVEPFMAFSMVVLTFNILTIPQLLQSKVCHNNYNESLCKHLSTHVDVQNEVQHKAAFWLSISPLISMLPGVFVMFMLGPFADIYGKKNTITLFPAVYFVQSIVFLVLVSIKQRFSPGSFIIASILSGMFGDNAGLELVCVAYLADTTTVGQRTLRVAVLEAFLCLGSIIACLLSGILLQNYGFKVIFITTGVINFVNFVYVLVFLPNEKTMMEKTSSNSSSSEDPMFRKFDDNSQLIDVKSEKNEELEKPISLLEACNPYRSFIRVKDAICTRGVGKTVANLLALMALAQIANMGELYVGVLFVKHSPFNLKPNEIGYFAAARSCIRALGMTALPYIFTRVFKFTDLGLVILGLLSQALYLCIYGSSVSKLMLYLTQFIGIAGSLQLPVLRSMTTKIVPDDQHGAALAAIEAVDVSSSIVASLVSNVTYSLTVKVCPGFFLYILGVFAFGGVFYAVLMVIFKARQSRMNAREKAKILLEIKNNEK